MHKKRAKTPINESTCLEYPSKKIHKWNLERLVVVAALSWCVLYWSEFRHVQYKWTSLELTGSREALQRGKKKMIKEIDCSIRNQRMSLVISKNGDT
jgi:hypothetical protein